jgi:hypothetical protein
MRHEPAYVFDDRFIDVMPTKHSLYAVFDDMAVGMREEREWKDVQNQFYLLITWWMTAILAPFAPLFLWQAIRPKHDIG